MQIDGGKVRDAKRGVRITISATDIQHAAKKRPENCAAALACKRELHADDVRIHIGRVYLKIGGEWLRFRTSPPLRREIVKFDRGRQFTPGEYRLDPPASRGPAEPTKSARPNTQRGDYLAVSLPVIPARRRGRPPRKVHIVVNNKRRYHKVGGIRPNSNYR